MSYRKKKKKYATKVLSLTLHYYIGTRGCLGVGGGQVGEGGRWSGEESRGVVSGSGGKKKSSNNNNKTYPVSTGKKKTLSPPVKIEREHITAIQYVYIYTYRYYIIIISIKFVHAQPHKKA